MPPDLREAQSANVARERAKKEGGHRYTTTEIAKIYGAKEEKEKVKLPRELQTWEDEYLHLREVQQHHYNEMMRRLGEATNKNEVAPILPETGMQTAYLKLALEYGRAKEDYAKLWNEEKNLEKKGEKTPVEMAHLGSIKAKLGDLDDLRRDIMERAGEEAEAYTTLKEQEKKRKKIPEEKIAEALKVTPKLLEKTQEMSIAAVEEALAKSGGKTQEIAQGFNDTEKFQKLYDTAELPQGFRDTMDMNAGEIEDMVKLAEAHQRALDTAKGKKAAPKPKEKTETADEIFSKALGARNVSEVRQLFAKEIDKAGLSFTSRDYYDAVNYMENLSKYPASDKNKELLIRATKNIKLMETQIMENIPRFGKPELLADLRLGLAARARGIETGVPGASRYEAGRAELPRAEKRQPKKNLEETIEAQRRQHLAEDLEEADKVVAEIIKALAPEIKKNERIAREVAEEMRVFGRIDQEVQTNQELRSDISAWLGVEKVYPDFFSRLIAGKVELRMEIDDLKEKLKKKPNILARALQFGPGSYRERKKLISEKERELSEIEKTFELVKDRAIPVAFGGKGRAKEETLADRIVDRGTKRWERVAMAGAGY